MVYNGYKYRLEYPLASLGDATADDVAAGKTFTSTAGIKIAGTNNGISSGGGGSGDGYMQKTVYDPMGKATDVFAYAENTAESKVSEHDTKADSHGDIRQLISGLSDRLNALAEQIPDESGTGGTAAGYPVVVMTASAAELTPNTYYKWGEAAALDITLAEPADTGVTNEYCFEFVSGETATTLTVPDTVKWVKEPEIEAGKTYQVSILNGVGVICGA